MKRYEIARHHNNNNNNNKRERRELINAQRSMDNLLETDTA